MIPNQEPINFRLGWPTICQLACMAMIRGITFEEVCVKALRKALREEADMLSDRLSMGAE